MDCERNAFNHFRACDVCAAVSRADSDGGIGTEFVEMKRVNLIMTAVGEVEIRNIHGSNNGTTDERE